MKVENQETAETPKEVRKETAKVDVTGEREEYDIIKEVINNVKEDGSIGDDIDIDEAEDAGEEAAEENAEQEETGEGAEQSESGEEEEKDESAEAESGDAVEDSPKEPLSRSWKAIKKKERKVIDTQNALKMEKEAFLTEKAQFDANRDALMKEINANPIKTLEKMGIDWDDVVAQVVNSQGEGGPVPSASKDPVVQELISTIGELKTEISSLKNETQTVQQANLNNEIAKFEREIAETLSLPKYSLLATKPGAIQEVKDYCGSHFGLTGEVLPTHQIADKLQEELRKELSTYSTNKEARRVLGLSNEDDDDLEAASNKPKKKGKKASPTITGNLSRKSKKPSDDEDDDYEDDFIANVIDKVIAQEG